MKTESIIEYLSAVDNVADITELMINRFDISGNIINVDINDLKNFDNLKKISISNMVLNEEDLLVISGISGLKILELYNCELVNLDLSKYINKMSLDKLLLDNTILSYKLIEKAIDYVVIKNSNLDEIVKCNILDITKAEVDLNSFNLKNYRQIIMSEKQFDKKYIDLLEGKVKITVMNDLYDIVEAEYE